MTARIYDIVVDEGNGYRFKIFNQPESTVRELGLLPASPTRIKQKAPVPVDDPEFATSKNILGDIQVVKVATMERKDVPKEEVVVVTRDRMGNLVGVR